MLHLVRRQVPQAEDVQPARADLRAGQQVPATCAKGAAGDLFARIADLPHQPARSRLDDAVERPLDRPVVHGQDQQPAVGGQQGRVGQGVRRCGDAAHQADPVRQFRDSPRRGLARLGRTPGLEDPITRVRAQAVGDDAGQERAQEDCRHRDPRSQAAIGDIEGFRPAQRPETLNVPDCPPFVRIRRSARIFRLLMGTSGPDAACAGELLSEETAPFRLSFPHGSRRHTTT
jgi:hypothetical protein